MKSKACLPISSSGEDRGQCKVRDPLGGVCLCQSQRPHWQVAFWEFLLPCERKYPSPVINVQTTEHHMKDQAVGRAGEMTHGLAVCSPALISITLLVALSWFLHTVCDSLVLSSPRQQLFSRDMATYVPFGDSGCLSSAASFSLSHHPGTSELVHPCMTM